MTELGNPLLGHAVSTAEVAAIGNGYAQVINAPVVGIDQTIHMNFYYSFSHWAGEGKSSGECGIRNSECGMERIGNSEFSILFPFRIGFFPYHFIPHSEFRIPH